MNRRRILASMGASSLSAVAGCFERIPGFDESGRDESPPERRDLPDFPETVTAETAAAFIDEHESVAYHNSFLENGSRPDSLNVGCSASLDREIDGDFYVVGSCGGSIRDEGDIIDLVGDRRCYRVFESGFQRTTVDALDDWTDIESSTVCAFIVANFDASEHELRVTVPSRSTAEDADATATSDGLGEPQTVATETAISWPLGIETGDHELVVERSDGTRETFDWTVQDEFSGITIYVTPAGELDIGPMPTEAL